MTKTEYREYISGEVWRKRRAEYLQGISGCERCDAPRKLVILVYDQDLHVHHRSYARIGNERPEDLEALCRRCHEVETFGKSELRKIQPYAHCEYCREPVWDFACDHGIEALCAECTLMLYGLSPRAITSCRLRLNEEGKLEPDMEFWKFVIKQILWMIEKDDVRKAVEITADCLERDDPGAWFNEIREIPSREGFVKRTWKKYKENAGGSALEDIDVEQLPTKFIN